MVGKVPDGAALVDELLLWLSGEDGDPVHHPLLTVVVLTLSTTTTPTHTTPYQIGYTSEVPHPLLAVVVLTLPTTTTPTQYTPYQIGYMILSTTRSSL